MNNQRRTAGWGTWSWPAAMVLTMLLTGSAAAQFDASRGGPPQNVPRGGQQPIPPNQQNFPAGRLPGMPDSSQPPDPTHARMEEVRARTLNDDRHKRLVQDTDKLLALATELKEQVNKSTKDELSVVVVKKAGEMEKLAHDVKERMRN